jgi:hypothetical protein
MVWLGFGTYHLLQQDGHALTYLIGSIAWIAAIFLLDNGAKKENKDL